jgi:hypothetical protein
LGQLEAGVLEQGWWWVVVLGGVVLGGVVLGGVDLGGVVDPCH